LTFIDFSHLSYFPSSKQKKPVQSFEDRLKNSSSTTTVIEEEEKFTIKEYALEFIDEIVDIIIDSTIDINTTKVEKEPEQIMSNEIIKSNIQ
jgi:hypothetical protein